MLWLDHTIVRAGDFTLQVDLTVEKGARLALMGASGSGKSTLLGLVAGFVLPDEGRVVIDGVDRSRARVADRPLSILFQDGNLFPHLSVFDNVALGLRTNLRLKPEERDRVHEALSRTGMAGMETRLPASLSGGQQSRVAIARILLRNTPLALMDEPFSALDPALRRDMLDLVAEICQDTRLTLIIVTHDLREARALCTDLCLLEAGKIVLRGPLKPLIDDPPPALKPWF